MKNLLIVKEWLRKNFTVENVYNDINVLHETCKKLFSYSNFASHSIFC